MRKSMPVLFVYVLICGTVAYYWGMSLGWNLLAGGLYSAASLAGLLGFVTVSFQLVTSARWRLLEERMGLDGLLHLHRRFGAAAFCLLVLHGMYLLADRITSGAGLPSGVYDLMGSAALALLFLIVITALFYKRFGLSYQASRRIHLLAYIAYGLGMNHSLFLGSTFYVYPELRYVWYLLGFAAFVSAVKNLMRRLSNFRNASAVEEVIRETGDIITLSVGRNDMDYLPGQFAFISAEVRGRKEFPHPFTISSNPEAETLKFSIKGSGDFTRSAGEISKGDTVFVDGPYGTFTFADRDAGEKILLIAGGIGITPFISNLRALAARGESRDIILLWGNKTPEDVPFDAELKAMDFVKSVYIFSRTETPGMPSGAAAVETGRIGSRIIEAYAPDAGEREIYVCGPPAMTKDVTDALVSLGVRKRRIHCEQFSF